MSNLNKKEIPVKRSFPGSDSSLATQERNDCFVRAIAAATGQEYEIAHTWVREVFKRKNGCGTRDVIPKMANMGSALGKNFTILPKEAIQTVYNNAGVDVKRCMTIGTFAQRYSTGTYLILVRAHAMTMIDGVIVGGNAEDGTRLKARIDKVFLIW